MKKLLTLFALCALASSSFAAVTVSDWKANFNGFIADGSISDVSPAGFDFDAGLTDIDDYRASFRSYNVSDWVYDENNTFSVVVTGFDDVTYNGNKPERLVIVLYRGYSCIVYNTVYSGAGTYDFGPADVYNFNGLKADDSFDSVEVDMALGYNPCYSTPTTTGSVRFIVGEEEKPDTVVPEPMAAVYGLFGLGSLIGIKRKIKK